MHCSTLVHSVPVYVFIIRVMNDTIPFCEPFMIAILNMGIDTKIKFLCRLRTEIC
jgi:hypothetical protein